MRERTRRRRKRRRRKRKRTKTRRTFKVKPEKKFPKIASIDPHNVCTKFIVWYEKFK